MPRIHNLRAVNFQEEELFNLIDELEENAGYNANSHFREILRSYNIEQHTTEKHSDNKPRYNEDTISCLIDAANSHNNNVNQAENFSITLNLFLMGFIGGAIVGIAFSQIGAMTYFPTHKFLASNNDKLITTVVISVVGGILSVNGMSDRIEVHNFHHEACICKNNAYQAEIMGETVD